MRKCHFAINISEVPTTLDHITLFREFIPFVWLTRQLGGENNMIPYLLRLYVAFVVATNLFIMALYVGRRLR